uniref:Putative secreted salivary gland peptide n=1 Tax=Ixodes ricinus TaxID=34613 RepID=A0A090X7X1_IXORI
MKLLLALAALVAVATAQIVERPYHQEPGRLNHAHGEQLRGATATSTRRTTTTASSPAAWDYVDSAGTNIDRHYEVGRDGKRRFIDAKDSKLKGPPPSFNFGPMPVTRPTSAPDRTMTSSLAGPASEICPASATVPGFGNLPGFGGAARRGGRY